MTSNNTLRARAHYALTVSAPTTEARANRPNDLPPKWDGNPVTWTAWEPELRTSWRFHSNPNDTACTACGLIEETDVATGRVRAPDGVTELHPLHARLHARRCRGCGHDTVHDASTDEHWDLEPEDYTDEGSTVEGALW